MAVHQRWGVLSATAALGTLLIAACSTGGAGGTRERSATTTTIAGAGAAAPEGFGTAAVTVRRVDGSLCRLCTYVARTAAEHQRGLMGVRGLGGLDGMTFRFAEPTPVRMWMRNTLIPLTGVWFADDGGFIAAVDMDPCPAADSNCPAYGPDAPAATVIEFPQGEPDRLGIGTGAVLESVGGPCEPNSATSATA